MEFPQINYPGGIGRSEDAGGPALRSAHIIGADGNIWSVDGDFIGTTNVAGGNFAFALQDATDADGPKILVLDGEINDEFPDGMGGDDYILPVDGDSEVWAVITYDTESFEINSRALDIGASVPDNSFGTVYYRIGKIWFDTSTTPPTMYFRNTHCGDIDLSLRYVVLNSVLYVEAFSTLGQPMEVPDA